MTRRADPSRQHAACRGRRRASQPVERKEHEEEHEEGRGSREGVGAQQADRGAARLVDTLVDESVPVDGLNEIASEEDGECEHDEADDAGGKHAPQPALVEVGIYPREERVEVRDRLPPLSRVAVQQRRVHLHLEEQPLVVLSHRGLLCSSSRPAGE
eukprot:scaffold175922_cov27-Tisochrysis_lutea.AAC.1